MSFRVDPNTGQVVVDNEIVYVDGSGGVVPVDETHGFPVNLSNNITVSINSAPANTGNGVDTVLTFAAPVRHVIIQNKTTANVYFAFNVAATLGSFCLYPGQMASMDAPCTALHIFTPSAQPLNGTADSNVVVQGWK